ncbi:MAG: hypothetical protein K2F81_05210 [Ruminococcus sp.]|nr:hypothetical protein [Ruminococcus sp.]
MSKFQKAISSALCVIFLFSVFFSHAEKNTEKYSMFFPGFSLGYSVSENDKEERVSIVKNDDDVEYSFKLFEILSNLFK